MNTRRIKLLGHDWAARQEHGLTVLLSGTRVKCIHAGLACCKHLECCVLQGVLRLAAASGILDVLQTGGLDAEDLLHLERFGYEPRKKARKRSKVRAVARKVSPGVCGSHGREPYEQALSA